MALNSKTNLKLIDAICEGPIEGFVHHRKSIFLNETEVTFDQLQQKVVFVDKTDGTQDQSNFRSRTVFSDAQTTIIPVGEQVGKNYSERLTQANLVKKMAADMERVKLFVTLLTQKLIL